MSRIVTVLAVLGFIIFSRANHSTDFCFVTRSQHVYSDLQLLHFSFWLAVPAFTAAEVSNCKMCAAAAADSVLNFRKCVYPCFLHNLLAGTRPICSIAFHSKHTYVLGWSAGPQTAAVRRSTFQVSTSRTTPSALQVSARLTPSQWELAVPSQHFTGLSYFAEGIRGQRG